MCQILFCGYQNHFYGYYITHYEKCQYNKGSIGSRKSPTYSVHSLIPENLCQSIPETPCMGVGVFGDKNGGENGDFDKRKREPKFPFVIN